MKLKVLSVLFALAAAGCGSHGVDSVQWMSMGTIAKVSFKGGGISLPLPAVRSSSADNRRLVEKVRMVYGDVERRLSVWNGDSEISRYVSLDGVSPEMRPCYENLC